MKDKDEFTLNLEDEPQDIIVEDNNDFDLVLSDENSKSENEANHTSLSELIEELFTEDDEAEIFDTSADAIEESEEVEIFDETVEESEEAEIVDEAVEESDEAAIVDETVEESEEAAIVDETVEESDESEIVDETVEESDEAEIVDETAEESHESEIVDETVEESDESEIVDETAEESHESEIVDETVEESDESEIVDETAEESDESEIVDETVEESDESEIVDETVEESDEAEIVDETAEESDEAEIVDETAEDEVFFGNYGEPEVDDSKVDVMSYLNAVPYEFTETDDASESIGDTQVFEPPAFEYDSEESGYVDAPDYPDDYNYTPVKTKKKRKKRGGALKAFGLMAALLVVVAGLASMISSVAFRVMGLSNGNDTSSAPLYEYSSSDDELNQIISSNDVSSDDFELIGFGDSGNVVTSIQSRLSELGYLEYDKITSVFDADTQLAVREFQSSNGLNDSGAVDEETYDMLFSENAAIATTTTTVTTTTTTTTSTTTTTASTTASTTETTTSTTTSTTASTSSTTASTTESSTTASTTSSTEKTNASSPQDFLDGWTDWL